jgi:predicted aspartyl protease
VLIDSGSTLDLISTGRAQEFGLATHSGGPNKVRLADGSLQACEETLDPVETKGGCSCHDAAVSCHRLAHL